MDHTESDQEPNQTDIEIYVKNIDAQDLLTFLSTHFKVNEKKMFDCFETDRARTYSLYTLEEMNEAFDLMITPKAAGKLFTSLWFKSSNTPWSSDKECALAYLDIADTEVRCSSASWHEEEEINSEQWLSLTREREKHIVWN